MSIYWFFIIIVGSLLMIWFGWGLISPLIWEKPEYEIIQKVDRVEIRKYLPARVLITESYSFGKAFSTLSGFIFGNNRDKKKVPMTTPVLTERTKENKVRMVFFVPRKFADQRERLPTPYGRDIIIETKAQQYIATIRFRGRFSQRKRGKFEQMLRDRLKKVNIEFLGESFIMQYSDPFVPPPLRINEVGMIIKLPE